MLMLIKQSFKKTTKDRVFQLSEIITEERKSCFICYVTYNLEDGNQMKEHKRVLVQGISYCRWMFNPILN